MTRHWTIQPLCFGWYPYFEKSFFTYGRHQGVKMASPCLGWLLQSDDEAILVDTGPVAPERAHPSHSKLSRSPDQVPDAALRAVGVEPDSLKLVVLSHLHYDHCYNLELFPRARFVVQAEELKAAVDPVRAQRSTYEFGIPGLKPPWLSVFDRLNVVHGDTDLVPGLRLVLLPGHTPGLQGVLVETRAGRYLLPSDAVPLYENLGSVGDDPPIPGIHTDVVACERSLEKMCGIADVILPSHDPEVMKKPVYP